MFFSIINMEGEFMEKEKYYTYTLDTVVLNILAFIVAIILIILVSLTYPSGFFYIDMNGFMLMILWLILHEIIHMIGFMSSKDVKKENITTGMFLEKGIFYCMCKQEIPKKVILFSLLLPLTTIGIITLILGYIFSSSLLVFLSVINISGCIGDIMMTIFMLKLPKDIKYLDLDDPTSFTIISKEDISNVKVMGIVKKESGIYDKENMYAKNKKKIDISKMSLIMLIVIIVLYIATLFI